MDLGKTNTLQAARTTDNGCYLQDAEEIVGGGDFTGGMAGDGEQEVVGMNAFAVIDDANEVGAAIHDVDFDAGGERVDAVIEEFFDGACRSLDDFTGSDFVNHTGIELMNAGNRFPGGFPFHLLIRPTDVLLCSSL